MGYFDPETMFLLSLPQDIREKFTDIIEEAVELRSRGLSRDEIAAALKQDIAMIESSSTTPRMVKRIVLGPV